jgi:hypothetical protein
MTIFNRMGTVLTPAVKMPWLCSRRENVDPSYGTDAQGGDNVDPFLDHVDPNCVSAISCFYDNVGHAVTIYTLAMGIIHPCSDISGPCHVSVHHPSCGNVER